MRTNQEPMGKNVAPEPATPFEPSDWAMQVLESGEELDEVVEHVMFLDMVSLLRATSGDEPGRYKALAEMHKFAKLLEQKRSRKERTENQKRRLDLVQAAQEIKLREIKLREMRMTAEPTAEIPKPEPAQLQSKTNEPAPPEPPPTGIAHELAKREPPCLSQPEQPQREASREVGAPPPAATPARFPAHHPRLGKPARGFRNRARLRSYPVPSRVRRGKRR